MKSRLLLLMTCILMCSISLPAQSSFGNKMKDKLLNKMKNKGEEKVDQTIDSAVDKPVDKTEKKVKESVKGSSSAEGSAAGSTQPVNNDSSNKEADPSAPADGNQQTPSDEQMQKWMESMGGGAVSIEDYPDLDEIQPSSWVGSFDMVTKGHDKNGKPLSDQDGSVSWFVNPYDVAMIPDITVNGERQDSRMIVKRKQGILIMLTNDNGNKTGFVIKLKTMSVDLSQTTIEDDMKDVQVEVNKNVTQIVNGQKCYKVRAWNDEFESISWVRDIGLSFHDLMSFMSVKSQGKSEYEDKFGHIRGIPIRTTSTDKQTGNVFVMDILNLYEGTPNSGMFNDEGYNLTEMPDFGGFGGIGGMSD